MRKLFTVILLLSFSISGLIAQQLGQATQFMDNKLMTNPGYAGSADVACISCLHRSQWIGLDGAPTSSMVGFHLPVFNNKIGVGAALRRDQLGPFTNWDFNMMYSYRVPLGNGKMAIGLSGKIKRYMLDLPSLRSTSGSDPLVGGAVESKIIPNFGAGFYYEAPRWYFGVSLQDIAGNDLNLSNSDAGEVFGKENVSEKVKFKPAALFKYVKDTPFSMDINASFIFLNKFTTGATYRMGGFKNTFGESFDLVAQYQINERMKIGVAYDFSIGMIRDVSSGTWEGLVQYCFENRTEGITNPRFF